MNIKHPYENKTKQNKTKQNKTKRFGYQALEKYYLLSALLYEYLT